MARNMKFYNVGNKQAFNEALSEGRISPGSIAFIKETREIWAQGVLYPCDFSAPTLQSPPAEDTLTYEDSYGFTRGFVPGQACVYRSAEIPDGYGIAYLKSVVDGVAVWQDLGNVMSAASDALDFSMEANEYAKAAFTNSNEAVRTADVAKNAVATLEGLANTDTAQQTLAAQVTQIAQNTSDVTKLKEKHCLMTEDEYQALELVDQEKIYMLYEE